MKKGLFNIAAAAPTTTTLIEQGLDSGAVSLISMTNTSTASVVVEVFLQEGSNESHLLKTVIPDGTTLVLDEGLAFNNSIFDLKIRTSTGAEIDSDTPLSVIVK